MQGLFPPLNTGAAARRYEPSGSRRVFPAVRGRAGSTQPQPGRAVPPGSGRRRCRRYRPQRLTARHEGAAGGPAGSAEQPGKS